MRSGVYVNVCSARRQAADLWVPKYLPVPSGPLNTSRSCRHLCSQLLWADQDYSARMKGVRKRHLTSRSIFMWSSMEASLRRAISSAGVSCSLTTSCCLREASSSWMSQLITSSLRLICDWKMKKNASLVYTESAEVKWMLVLSSSIPGCCGNGCL